MSSCAYQQHTKVDRQDEVMRNCECDRNLDGCENDDDDDEELADVLFILKADAERGGSRIRRADPGGGPGRGGR